MSTNKVKGDSFPPVQKQIILSLAKNGPQNINKTSNDIHKQYKSTHTALKTLIRKGFLEEVSKEPYRGQEYPKYWLTMEGQILALVHGAKVSDVKKYALRFCDETEIDNLLFLFDLTEHLGAETTAKMYRVALTGKIEFSYFPIRQEDIDIFFKIIKKYPKIWKPLEANLNQVLKL